MRCRFLKAKTRLPVVVDPTHGIGLREFIPQMALAAVAAGADALMIEVHDDPERARSDGDQALRAGSLRRSRAADSRRRRRGRARRLRTVAGFVRRGTARRGRAQRADRAAARARCDDGERAGRFLARHRIGAGVSRRGARARDSKQTLWVICPSVRTAGTAHESLVNWLPGRALPPRGGVSRGRKHFAGPGDRGGTARAPQPARRTRAGHVIVATRASLAQPAPPRGALRAAALRLRRGATRSARSGSSSR